MRTAKIILAVIALGGACSVSRSELEIISTACPQSVFGGDSRAITITLHNTSATIQQADLLIRLFQTTSATAVPLGDVPWKKIQVLPGQTILEIAWVSFPFVRAETSFLIQWLDRTNHIIGKTEVLVYPTNLLAELKTLAGDDPLGVFDPDEKLKPLLKTLQLEFIDLENVGLQNFIGKLAVIGPFSSEAQLRTGLANDIEKLARKGKAVVWILPRPEPRDELSPTFFVVPEGSGCVAVAQSDMVASFAEHPQAQLNLLHFARLALRPEPPRLPKIAQH